MSAALFCFCVSIKREDRGRVLYDQSYEIPVRSGEALMMADLIGCCYSCSLCMLFVVHLLWIGSSDLQPQKA